MAGNLGERRRRPDNVRPFLGKRLVVEGCAGNCGEHDLVGARLVDRVHEVGGGAGAYQIVAVDEPDVVARRVAKPLVAGWALADVLLVNDGHFPGIRRLEFTEDVEGVVRRAVVDGDDLDGNALLRQDGFKQRTEALLRRIVDGNDERDGFHRHLGWNRTQRFNSSRRVLPGRRRRASRRRASSRG